MSYFKQSVKTFIGLILLFFVGCVLEVIPFNHIFPIRHIPAFYFLFLSTGLLLYFRNTVIGDKMRTSLVGISAMLVLWFVIRIAKYSSFAENDFMTRMLWYAYYFPMLSVSQLSFMTSLTLGKTVENKKTGLIVVTSTVTAFFILIILTNDLHGLVFIFGNGFVKDVQNYSHGLLFWIAYVWNFLLLLISLVTTVIKSQVLGSRRYSWILGLYSLIFAAWLIILALDIRPNISDNNYGEFPETVCFLVGGLWLLYLRMGFIPSNIGYGKALSISSMSVLIADSDFNEVYKSSSFLPMTREQFSSAEPFMLNQNVRVFREPISGGYVYRQVDLTELNAVNARLDDVNEALGEENELIRLENELKQKRAEIDAKSKTYDDIAVMVLPQSKAVDTVVEETRKNPCLFIHNMRIIAVYTCYIKRMGNLMLMASEQTTLMRDELKLALSESVRYLEKIGIIASVNEDDKNPALPSKKIVSAYATFQKVLEEALPTFQAICLTLIDDVMKITVEGAEIQLSEDDGGSFEIDNDTTFIKLYLGDGGAK